MKILFFALVFLLMACHGHHSDSPATHSSQVAATEPTAESINSTDDVQTVPAEKEEDNSTVSETETDSPAVDNPQVVTVNENTNPRDVDQSAPAKNENNSLALGAESDAGVVEKDSAWWSWIRGVPAPGSTKATVDEEASPANEVAEVEPDLAVTEAENETDGADDNVDSDGDNDASNVDDPFEIAAREQTAGRPVEQIAEQSVEQTAEKTSLASAEIAAETVKASFPTFAEVKTNLHQLLGCAADEQLSYSRPTKAALITSGFATAILAQDQVLEMDHDLVLDDDSLIQRVFAQTTDQYKNGAGKILVALLALPESSHAAQNTDLSKRGIWFYQSLALLAFQCVDQDGQPAARGLQVHDYYLTAAPRGKLELAMGDDGYYLSAEKNSLVLRSTAVPAATRDIFLGSFSSFASARKIHKAMWVTVNPSKFNFREEFIFLKKQFAAKYEAEQDELKVLTKNLQELQRNQQQINRPDKRSVLNRPLNFYYRFAMRQHGQNVNFYTRQNQQRLELIDEARELLGEL